MDSDLPSEPSIVDRGVDGATKSSSLASFTATPMPWEMREREVSRCEKMETGPEKTAAAERLSFAYLPVPTMNRKRGPGTDSNGKLNTDQASHNKGTASAERKPLSGPRPAPALKRMTNLHMFGGGGEVPSAAAAAASSSSPTSREAMRTPVDAATLLRPPPPGFIMCCSLNRTYSTLRAGTYYRMHFIAENSVGAQTGKSGSKNEHEEAAAAVGGAPAPLPGSSPTSVFLLGAKRSSSSRASSLSATSSSTTTYIYRTEGKDKAWGEKTAFGCLKPPMGDGSGGGGGAMVASVFVAAGEGSSARKSSAASPRALPSAPKEGGFVAVLVEPDEMNRFNRVRLALSPGSVPTRPLRRHDGSVIQVAKGMGASTASASVRNKNKNQVAISSSSSSSLSSSSSSSSDLALSSTTPVETKQRDGADAWPLLSKEPRWAPSIHPAAGCYTLCFEVLADVQPSRKNVAIVETPTTGNALGPDVGGFEERVGTAAAKKNRGGQERAPSHTSSHSTSATIDTPLAGEAGGGASTTRLQDMGTTHSLAVPPSPPLEERSLESDRQLPAVFELGKISEDAFQIAFAAPFSPFQAFSTAIAIFEGQT